MRRTNTFHDKIAPIKAILWALMPTTVVAGLVLGIIMLNLIVDASPQTIKIKRAQELAIMQKQAKRDKPEFDRLRKKHGLAATAVVIHELGETPYYYGADREKIALK
jgi:hypothetical protein